MKKLPFVFFLCVVTIFTTYADESLYCEDPHTGLHYPINSTWPSTTFCGTYTCHAIVDEENGNFKKVPKIVPNINEVEENEDKEKEGDKEILENGSGDFDSLEKENSQSHEISDSDWDENEFGKLYELYKIASDLGESIKKAESELKLRDYGTEKNANQIEKEYKKLPITNTDNFCKENKNYQHQSNEENHIQSGHNEAMTAAMYKDYNKYYSQYPYYNYQYDHYKQTSDAETSPSDIENSYTGYTYPEGYESNYTQYYSDQDYYNYYYAYIAEHYPEYYKAEEPKVNATAEIHKIQLQNQTQAKQTDEHKHHPHDHNHHHHHQDDKTKEAVKIDNNEPNNEMKNNNSSDYETEYHTFYHDFISKYPNSTAYSSKPTDEDTKHFYSVYYERFPHKRPVATTKGETPEHNHDTQNREDLAKQKEAIVSDEEQEKSQNANTPEFKTTGKDFDKEGALEELQNWADYRHPKETIQWKANPFDAPLDKDVYLTTSRHSDGEMVPGKYDWINSKLGQFGVPLPAKPYRSPNLNPLFSSVLLQPKFRNVLKRLPAVHHHPHVMRRKRSPRTKTFMTVKGCPLQMEPGYFKNGDPNQQYPKCCPQKIN